MYLAKSQGLFPAFHPQLQNTFLQLQWAVPLVSWDLFVLCIIVIPKPCVVYHMLHPAFVGRGEKIGLIPFGDYIKKIEDGCCHLFVKFAESWILSCVLFMRANCLSGCFKAPSDCSHWLPNMLWSRAFGWWRTVSAAAFIWSNISIFSLR